MNRQNNDVIPPPADLSYDDQNPFGDISSSEGNPFAEPAGGNNYRIPDYGDGGTYEDDFYSPPPAQSPTQQAPRGTYTDNYTNFDDEPDNWKDVDTEQGAGVGQSQQQSQQQQQPGQQQFSPESKKNLHFWNVAYYSDYFNVDTPEVMLRITRSVLPFSVKFFDSVERNPDLYGPFWIATTLIFCIAAAGNFASWIDDKDHFKYDFKQVTFAAGMIYAYIAVVPLLLWLSFRWLKVPLTLLQMVCLYGYAMFIFIPVSVLCILPFNWLRWILIGAGTLTSLVFIVMNFFPSLIQNSLKESHKFLGGIIILAIQGLIHLGVGLTFKLYFFNYAD